MSIGRIVGVRLETLGLPAREALRRAAMLGVDAVEFDAVGPLAPKELSQTGRRELRQLLRTYSLRLSTIGCPTRNSFDHSDRLEGRIQATSDALELAHDLGCPAVIHYLGKVPDKGDTGRRPVFDEAIRRVASEADRRGARLSLQVGLDRPDVVVEALTQIGVPSLGINIAPVRMLGLGVDLPTNMELLHPWLLGLHASDGVRSGISATGFREVPLGEGEVDWPRLLTACDQIEFLGPFILVQPTADAGEGHRHAIEYLRSH